MYDAWQAQQRARKEEERKAKTEAAAALQGYRRSGLSEEETKLSALREQERLQKLNAEQQLHGYRGQLSEEEAKLAAQKQAELRKKQELESQLRHNGVTKPTAPHTVSLTENSGVVSALAAEYSSPSQPHFSSPTAVTGASTTNSSNNSESLAVDGNPMTAIAAATPTTPTTPATTPTEMTMSPVALSPPPSLPPQHTVELDSDSSIQSAVMFMFGILTADDFNIVSSEDRCKLVGGYLARADEITKSVIADDNNNSSSFQSILSSLAYPVTKSVEKDYSRTDVNRTMVTVAISFSAKDNETAEDFRTQVVERVRDAICTGKFTK